MTSHDHTVSKLSFSMKYKNYITPTIDLTAGSAGGIACVLVGQPLDTVKVKMQTFPNLYKNSVVCFKETLFKEGIRGLYAGTVPALVANVAENSVLFCAYGVCQNAVQFLLRKESAQSLNPLENACAGFLAAFFSSFSLCPTELIKCRLQAMRETQGIDKLSKKIGPWRLTKDIIKKDGFLGLFRGFGPTVAREMPGYFFFFGGYELSRSLMTPPGKSKNEIGLLKTTIAGGIGGVSFWVAIFPADVLKSRIQISESSDSMMTVTKKIIKSEGQCVQYNLSNFLKISLHLMKSRACYKGFRGLYKGLGPTVVRTFPASGALFVAYEYTKRFCNYLLDF